MSLTQEINAILIPCQGNLIASERDHYSFFLLGSGSVLFRVSIIVTKLSDGKQIGHRRVSLVTSEIMAKGCGKTINSRKTETFFWDCVRSYAHEVSVSRMPVQDWNNTDTINMLICTGKAHESSTFEKKKNKLQVTKNSWEWEIFPREKQINWFFNTKW